MNGYAFFLGPTTLRIGAALEVELASRPTAPRPAKEAGSACPEAEALEEAAMEAIVEEMLRQGIDVMTVDAPRGSEWV